MAKIRELKEKTRIELENLLKDKRETLRKFRFEMGHGKTKNTKQGKETKRDIARILTLLRKK
jgi:ribosomal protein L29